MHTFIALLHEDRATHSSSKAILYALSLLKLQTIGLSFLILSIYFLLKPVTSALSHLQSAPCSVPPL